MEVYVLTQALVMGLDDNTAEAARDLQHDALMSVHLELKSAMDAAQTENDDYYQDMEDKPPKLVWMRMELPKETWTAWDPESELDFRITKMEVQ